MSQVKEDETKVSVVVPFFNRSKFAQRLLDSVFNQTLKPICIFIVDNGSSLDELSKLYKVIQSFSESMTEVVLVSTIKTGNANYARNLGMDLAKTRYVAFLDSDDWWDKAHLENSVRTLKSNNKAAVYSGALIHDGGIYINKSIDVNSLSSPFSIFSSKKSYSAQTSSYLIDMKKIRSVVSWDERLKRHQDYDFFLSIFYNTSGWAFLPTPTSHLDWESGGTKINLDYKSMIRFLKKWRYLLSINELKDYAYMQVLSCVRTQCHPMYLKYYKKMHRSVSNPVISSFICSTLYLESRQKLIALIRRMNLKPILKRLIFG